MENYKKEEDLFVGGFVPFTTIDFPIVNAACVVFCQGCFWRCPYCQNKGLQLIKRDYSFRKEIFPEILKRKGFIDGIVFSGGEPLLQPALVTAAKLVKEEGFSVALHTSGAIPEILEAVLPYIDWIGLDIKTIFSKYDSVTRCEKSEYFVQKSLDILLKSKKKFECRTTVDSSILQPKDVLEIAKTLKKLGVINFAIQECFDEERNTLYSECFDTEFLEKLKQIFPNIIVRRA
jgi:pyruvate formate lyase activating enzyme